MTPLVGRGAAGGDLDRDGDPDLVLTENNGPAHVLINQFDDPSRSLTLELRGKPGNSLGFGSIARLEAGDEGLVRHLLSATSYLSQGEPAIHFGLGDREGGAVRLRWPGGRTVRYRGLQGGKRYVGVRVGPSPAPSPQV